MALDLDMMASDFADMVNDLPHYLTFGGNTVQVIFDDAESRESADLAGMVEGADGSAWWTIDDQVTAPDVGDVVSIASTQDGTGVNYRVISVSDSPDGVARKLTLKAEEE